jgi:YVTN family beta-propeller protein
MSAKTRKAWPTVPGWRVMPAVLISLTAGLGSVTPTPQAAADAAPLAMSYAALAESARPITAYVVNYASGTVTPISIATNTASPPITVGAGPVGIAITPDGQTAYVTNNVSGTVTPITTATNTAGPPITVGGGPEDIAITPDGETAYVVNEDLGNQFLGAVTPITTATNPAGPPITVGPAAYEIAITPDGKTAYLPFSSELVVPVSIATNIAGPPITVGADPRTIAITPDGETAYVVNQASGTVTPITTATNTAGPAITVGSNPQAIAITPATTAQGPAFTSGSAATAPVRAAFTFTVAATGDPAPKISRTGQLPSGVRFADNGDGTATISGTPVKATAGVYRLALTARNKNGTATQAFTLTVTSAPAIRKIGEISVKVGAALRLTVRTTGYPAPALAESGPLPAALSFTDNGNGTAVVTGTLTASSGGGRYPVTITATNSSGTATRHFIIVVTQRATDNTGAASH